MLASYCLLAGPACMQWLVDRPRLMRQAMLKPPGHNNIMFDTSVVQKLTQPGAKRLAGAAGRAARVGRRMRQGWRPGCS